MNVKRWIEIRVDLARMQRVLGIKLKRYQRRAALMDESPITVLSKWGRGSGKTTVAIIWMALHEEREEIRRWGRSRLDYPHGRIPDFIPDPDLVISNVQGYNYVFKLAKEMCDRFRDNGISVPKLVFG